MLGNVEVLDSSFKINVLFDESIPGVRWLAAHSAKFLRI